MSRSITGWIKREEGEVISGSGTHMCKGIELGKIWGWKGSNKLLDLAATLSQVRGQEETEAEAGQTDWVR